MSRNSTNRRASASAAMARDSATVFGSRRSLCGAGPRGRISSNDSTRCGTLSSSTSKSCAVRSVDRRAVERHVGVEPHEVGAAAKARLLLSPRLPVGAGVPC